MKSAVFTSLLAGLLSVSPAHAQDLPAGTLEHISQSGTIHLGYRESSAPFSYLDGQGKPIGYSIDLCLKVVDALRKQPGMPRNLSVEWVPVSSSNRIAASKWPSRFPPSSPTPGCWCAATAISNPYATCATRTW